MSTIGELLTKGYDILKSSHIESYRLDSQLILSYVLKKDKLHVILNRNENVSDEAKDAYMEFIKLRAQKMPVKYITGECEFMGLNFKVRQGVLIPRPDTEILTEEVIKEVKSKNYRNACDVCCGSGAIGISLAEYTPLSHVICLDISNIAIETAKENARLLSLSGRVSIFKSDLLKYSMQKDEHYDVIVSNPPYIRTCEVGNLMDEVKNYEPHEALNGGCDGLDFYRKITEQSVSVLNEGGLLAFEIGYDEKEAVWSIMKQKGFIHIKSFKDLAGLDRVVMGTLP